MERGFVHLWRKCLDSGLLQNGPAWQLFGYYLLKATHKPVTLLVGSQVVKLSPGQLVAGRQKASKDLGLSEQQIRTAQKLLENMKIVTSSATNKFTIITLVNWHIYQQEQPANNQQNHQRPTNSQPTANHKQEQENKRTRREEKYISPPVTSAEEDNYARALGSVQGGGGEGQDTPLLPDNEPHIDFVELRQHYDERIREEGPMTGFREFCQLRASRTSFPGIHALMDAIDTYADVYGESCSLHTVPGLARFIGEGFWKKKPQARASPATMTFQEKADAALWERVDQAVMGGDEYGL